MTIEQVARITHEANRLYCEAVNDPSPQPPWEQAPQWQRESAIHGVRLHMANPDLPDSALHAAWMGLKRAAGWTYGPVKDETLKSHPCLVPFDQLPIWQQRKDALFAGIVRALLPMIYDV
jgi:hypothetical protein